VSKVCQWHNIYYMKGCEVKSSKNWNKFIIFKWLCCRHCYIS
jgi:hypothetical protein